MHNTVTVIFLINYLCISVFTPWLGPEILHKTNSHK